MFPETQVWHRVEVSLEAYFIGTYSDIVYQLQLVPKTLLVHWVSILVK